MKKYLVPFVLLSTILFVGCENKVNLETEKSNIGYKNGLTLYKGEPFNGILFNNYSDGKIKEEGTFINGEGKWKWYDENGNVELEGFKINLSDNISSVEVIKGKYNFNGEPFNGVLYSNFPNGNIKEEGTFINGEGKWKWYDENGNVELEGIRINYNENKVNIMTTKEGLTYYMEEPFNGILFNNYSDGKIKEEGTFINGEGKWKWYNQNGDIVLEGLRLINYFKNEYLISERGILYYMGNPFSGELTSYFEYPDKVFEIKFFKLGKLHGRHIVFNNDGELHYSETYKNGKKDGKSIFNYNKEVLYHTEGLLTEKLEYHENGKLFVREFYKEGYKNDGVWIMFDEEGRLQSFVEYENGVKINEYVLDNLSNRFLKFENDVYEKISLEDDIRITEFVNDNFENILEFNLENYGIHNPFIDIF